MSNGIHENWKGDSTSFLTSGKDEEIRQKLLKILQDNIRSLLSDHIEGEPVTDDVVTFKNLLDVMELILKHRLKESVNGNSVFFYHFLLQSQKLDDKDVREKAIEINNYILSCESLVTEEAKGRTWLRYIFKYNLIHLLTSLVESDIKNLWYEPEAFMESLDYPSIFVSLVTGLLTLKFEIETVKQVNVVEEFQTIRKTKKKKTRRNIKPSRTVSLKKKMKKTRMI